MARISIHSTTEGASRGTVAYASFLDKGGARGQPLELASGAPIPATTLLPGTDTVHSGIRFHSDSRSGHTKKPTEAGVLHQCVQSARDDEIREYDMYFITQRRRRRRRRGQWKADEAKGRDAQTEF